MKVLARDAAGKKWLLFQDPWRVFQTDQISEIEAIVKEVQEKVRAQRFYAAGFFSYEAAPAFDNALQVHKKKDALPLIALGLYQEAAELDDPFDHGTFKGTGESFALSPWIPSLDTPAYDDKILRIKNHLYSGNSYQVNFTLRLKAYFSGQAFSFFKALIQGQQAGFAAFVESEEFALCSASPELFFLKEQRTITLKPMKGTAPRGKTPRADKKSARWLQGSPKNRAENLMIVDMIRNDLAKIADPGSVRVPHLFTLESYPTLFQMTSTVQGEVDCSFWEILQALFPCASITGAPKVRTMEIIKELENSPRGIYTGSIGYLSPQNSAQFNVAIRTVFIDKKNHRAEYGVGGGIVWDSRAEEEYQECLIKAKILDPTGEPFKLIESLLLEEGSLFLLEKHMDRLVRSARFFGMNTEVKQWRNCLLEIAAEHPQGRFKVRLLLDAQGSWETEINELIPLPVPYRVHLAKQALDKSDPFLFHKTNRRTLFSQALEQNPGYDDLLFYNSRGELTESTMANLAVKIDGQWFTPPVESGLLPGVFRGALLDQGILEERSLLIADLKNAQELALINSVRKWIKITLKMD